MTRTQLLQRAASRGYTLHESVTDDRLSRIHPRMLSGKPVKLAERHIQHLEGTIETIRDWIKEGHYIAAYDLGSVGEEVIAPPTTMEDLRLIILPGFHIVAKVEGQGEHSDGHHHSSVGLTYTILSHRKELDHA